ncbi:MAG: hypothetical protein R3F04_05610 [Lysobacteraceae bacterium]
MNAKSASNHGASALAQAAFLALSLLLVWQIVFWVVIHIAERSARPIQMDSRASVDYLLLDGDGRTDSKAIRNAHRAGLDGYPVSVGRGAEGARIRFLVPFEVVQPGVPLALFLAIREEIAEIRVNGHVVQPSDPLVRLEGLLTSEPGYYPLAAQHLRPGSNLLEVDKVINGFDVALSEFAVGPAEALAEAYRWKNLLLTDLPMVGVGVLVFALLLCQAVNWPEADRPRIRALMLLLGSCALSTWFMTFKPPWPLGLSTTVLIWCLLNAAMAVAVALYVWFDTQWGRDRPRWLYLLSWLLIGLFACGFVTARLVENSRYWLLLILHVSYWLVIAVVALAVVVLALSVVRDAGRRWFERSVLALCISALAMDRLGSLYDLHSPFDADLPLSLPWSPLIGVLLGLSVVLALAREAAHARRTVLDANRVLTQTLQRREAELSASFAERNEILRRSAILEERGRIVRDMHDGVGGQLVRLQAQLRTQPLDREALATALDDSLGDLRLIVDALDTAEDGLYDALVAFERRLRQQLGGQRFTSRYDFGGAPDQFGARVTLQVLRILQEAVSNALRHAHASELQLCVEPDSTRQLLCVLLRDNGSGLSAAAGPGHGLSNMQQRAAEIGAEFSVHSDADGTRVRLLLPLPRSLSDLKNRSENSAGRGQFLPVSPGNS